MYRHYNIHSIHVVVFDHVSIHHGSIEFIVWGKDLDLLDLGGAP